MAISDEVSSACVHKAVEKESLSLFETLKISIDCKVELLFEKRQYISTGCSKTIVP